MSNVLYRGMSSFSFTKKGDSFSLTNYNLVKRDLLNAIFTKKGSVPKNRNFGTSISTLLFRPLTEEIVSQVQTEIEAVIRNEPRIYAINLNLQPNFVSKSLYVNMEFGYVETKEIVDSLELNLNFEG